MALFFLANALWWGYRVGATIARGYLDWEAARRGTTLQDAFRQAEFRQARGEFNAAESALIDFVKFNDRWAWTDPQEFAIDTAAVATAGLGLAAKVGLGKRIATVFGVKQAPALGTVIDGLIDFTGSLLAGKATSPVSLLGGILDFVTKSRKDLAPTIKAGQKVVTAGVKLGGILQGLLDPVTSPVDIIKRPLALGQAIQAGVDLFASLLGFWTAVEPHLPETQKPQKPLIPGETREERLRRLREAGEIRRPRLGPPPGETLLEAAGQQDVVATVIGEVPLTPVQPPVGLLVQPPVIGTFPIQPGVVTPEQDLILGRKAFTRRFGHRVGVTDLRRVLEELKKG